LRNSVPCGGYEAAALRQTLGRIAAAIGLIAN
jgi:hypothetical protein